MEYGFSLFENCQTLQWLYELAPITLHWAHALSTALLLYITLPKILRGFYEEQWS